MVLYQDLWVDDAEKGFRGEVTGLFTVLSLQLGAEIAVLVVFGTDVIVDGVEFFGKEVDEGGERFVRPVFHFVPREMREVLVKGFCEKVSVEWSIAEQRWRRVLETELGCLHTVVDALVHLNLLLVSFENV